MTQRVSESGRWPVRLESVQVLRGLAACAVLVSHVALEMRHHTAQISTGLVNALNTGRAGVDVFFVISGFVMVYVTYSRFGSVAQSGRFMIERMIRIVPVYWFYTTVMLAMTLLLPRMLHHTSITSQYITASYLFYPDPRPGDGEIRPVLDLGWTLNYEMYFYLLFAAVICFTRRVGLLLLVAFFVAAVTAGRFITPALPAAWFWSRPVILEFLAGVGVGLLFRSNIRCSRATGAAVLILASSWLLLQAGLGGGEMRVVRFGLPAVLLVSGCTLIRPAEVRRGNGAAWRFLLLMGDASYSLYLSHMFVVGVATRGIDAVPLGVFLPVYCFFVVALALLVAVLSYRFIEMPAKTALKRLLALRRPAPEEAMVH